MSMEGDPIAVVALTPFVAAVVAVLSPGLKPSWYWTVALCVACVPVAVVIWVRGSMDVRQVASAALGFLFIPTAAVFAIARVGSLRARPRLAAVIGLAAYFVLCLVALSVLVELELIRK
jgi:hypothetical protein